MIKTLAILAGIAFVTPALAASPEALAIMNLQNQMAFEGLMNRMQQQRLHEQAPPVIYYAPAPVENCNEWLHHPTMEVDAKTAAWNRCRGVR
jgi:hypothetical protein